MSPLTKNMKTGLKGVDRNKSRFWVNLREDSKKDFFLKNEKLNKKSMMKKGQRFRK